MRHALYRNFYETIKQFIEEPTFVIEYELLGEVYVLAFDKKEQKFYFKDSDKPLPKKEDVYTIIKPYVDRLIAKKQKESFNGTFRLESKNKFFKIKDENDKKIFIELISRFDDFLWEEPISIMDVSVIDANLDYAFVDCDVSKWCLKNIIDIIKNYNILDIGQLYNYHYSSSSKAEEIARLKSEFEILEKAGYLVLDKDETSMYKNCISFTEEFYEALKMSFYYDYDPIRLLNTEEFKRG